MHRGLVIGDVEAAGTPILLVHCMIDNRSIFSSWGPRCPAARPGSWPTGRSWTRWSFPSANAELNHPDLTVRNIEIHATGHMSLPINGDVVHGISTTLAQLGADGSLLRAGVTELKPRN